MKEKVSQLENVLSQKVYQVKSDKEANLKTKSLEMKETFKITNKILLIKCSLIFMAALILFFSHTFLSFIHLTIGWISLLASLLLLASTTNSADILIDSNEAEVELRDFNENKSRTNQSHNSVTSGIDFESLIHKVEWSTLLFFSGLFIFMKCIEELGLLNFLGNKISDFISSIQDKSDRLVYALLILIVLSALISSVIGILNEF